MQTLYEYLVGDSLRVICRCGSAPGQDVGFSILVIEYLQPILIRWFVSSDHPLVWEWQVVEQKREALKEIDVSTILGVNLRSRSDIMLLTVFPPTKYHGVQKHLLLHGCVETLGFSKYCMKMIDMVFQAVREDIKIVDVRSGVVSMLP